MSLLTLDTCAADRALALRYIRAAYPAFCCITDSPESAGLVLDLVTEGVIILRDPLNDPPGQRRIGFMAGPSYDKRRDEVQALMMALHEKTESGRRMDLQKKACLEEEKVLAAEAKRQRRAAKRRTQ